MYLKQIFDLRTMEIQEIQEYVWSLRGGEVWNDIISLYCNEVEHYMILRFPHETKRRLRKSYDNLVNDELTSEFIKLFPSLDLAYNYMVEFGIKKYYPFKLLK